MIPHETQVATRFSAAAATYETAALLQREVARRVVDLVPADAPVGTVLDAGCGTGALTTLARARWPDARITGVDSAAGMITEALRKFAMDARFSGVVADLFTFQAEADYDLVISSSALHWLRPFAGGFARTAHMVKPGGYLAAALMLDGTLEEVQAARQAVAPHKAPVARLPTLNDLENAVRMLNGFRCHRLDPSIHEQHYASAHDALRGFHAAGVTGGVIAREGAPLNRRELRALEDWYDRHARSSAGVRATYVTVYVLVQRDH